MSTTAEAPPAEKNGNGDPKNIAPAVPAATNVTLAEAVAQIGKVSAELKTVVIESDELVDAAILALVSRTHLYAAGSGGVGKTFLGTELAKRIALLVFYIQFRNDTKREEVFGPLSMVELQKDRYVHITPGYAPEAEVSIFDEFKDAGRFTRQLLNLLNERWFVNGGVRYTVPLRTAIGTTNFWIEEQELEALFDRFAQRIVQEPVKTSKGFKQILEGQLKRDRDEAAGKPEKVTVVTREMLDMTTAAVLTCKVDKGIVNATDELRKAATKENQYMSPRRWGEGLKLARAVAVLAGRDHVTEDDLRIYQRVLPNHPDDFALARDLTKHLRDKMTAVVEDAQRGLEDVRKMLAPVREGLTHGATANAEQFSQVSEASKLRATIEEKIEQARRAHHGDQPHAALDTVLADMEAEGAFMQDVVLGKVGRR